MSDIHDLASGAADALARLPRTTYTIPEDARLETDPKKVTIRVITSGEEWAARASAKRKGVEYEQEGAKYALCAIDGQPLTWERNQVEEAYFALSPAVRELVVMGFMERNMAKQSAYASFLASAKTA